MTLVSNGGLRPSRDPMVRHVVVAKSADAADDWIAEAVRPGDVVVTQDIPLAARCVEKGAHVLGNSGREHTPETIGMAVAMRDLKQHLRETGEDRGFNRAFTRDDRSAFLQSLDRVCRRALRDAVIGRSERYAMIKRHFPFYVAAILGLAAYVLAYYMLRGYAIAVAGNAFFITYLGLNAIRLPALTADYLKRYAQSADEPSVIIMLVTLGAVAVATLSLFLAINDNSTGAPYHLLLSLASVALGWLTIHMMGAFHYAHVYWRPSGEKGSPAGKVQRWHGGLDFPGTKEPGIFDFLYFAYVVGMTAQTSDVSITTTRMRRINLLHAIVSFFFNTVLVAAAVNVARQPRSVKPSPEEAIDENHFRIESPWRHPGRLFPRRRDHRLRDDVRRLPAPAGSSRPLPGRLVPLRTDLHPART